MFKSPVVIYGHCNWEETELEETPPRDTILRNANENVF